MEKANADFEANKKEFCSFGRRVEREELKHCISGRVVLMMLSMITGNRKWSKVNECHRYSVEHELDRDKNNKTGGSDGLVGELLK